MTRSGGCQCGAIRFAVAEGGLGGGSICHCRMCQKAFGAFYGPFIMARNDHLTWTRGRPAYFQSSNLVRRGFCAACGTPLTYEATQGRTELAIGAFDDPAGLAPIYQLSLESRLPYVTSLDELPERSLSRTGEMISYQHPDHDTTDWPR